MHMPIDVVFCAHEVAAGSVLNSVVIKVILFFYLSWWFHQ